MQISEEAWHYRLQSFWHMDRPRALCAYFWYTVIAVLLIPTFVGIASFGGFIILSPFLSFYFSIESGFVFVGTVVDAALLFFLLMHLTKRQRAAARRKRRAAWEERRALRPPKPPSMVWAYIKAAHRKVCPFIKYVS